MINHGIWGYPILRQTHVGMWEPDDSSWLMKPMYIYIYIICIYIYMYIYIHICDSQGNPDQWA